MPTEQEIVEFVEANKTEIFSEQHALLKEARNSALEEAADSCDRMAVQYDEYASKYDDEDGARAEWQAHTCRSRAEAIRNMKTK